VTQNDGCAAWTQYASNGKYLTVDFAASGCTNLFLAYEGSSWVMTKMNFHSPSEHTIGGGYYDGEVQMMHTNSVTKHIAVVSVFLSVDPGGLSSTNNTFLARIWAAGAGYSYDQPIVVNVNPTWSTDLSPYEDFTPGTQGQFQYVGSLTEPPCTQDIDYIIMKDPVMISATDLKMIRSVPRQGRVNGLTKVLFISFKVMKAGR